MIYWKETRELDTYCPDIPRDSHSNAGDVHTLPEARSIFLA